MIRTERLMILPFDMKYLEDYYNGFNDKITKYQWPDPFDSITICRSALQQFINEMDIEETLILSLLVNGGVFIGSVEVHGLSGACPELGIWIKESEQNKGYAYEALCAVLDYVRLNFGKAEFYYEADIRNAGSIRLLRKLENKYKITKQEIDRLTTESGKKLELQGHILTLICG